MTDLQKEHEYFCGLFDDFLIKNGNPFSIIHEKGGLPTYYGVLNKKHAFVDNALSVDFLTSQKKLRINLYVRDDLLLYNRLFTHKADIETIMNTSCDWVAGDKNPNTRRVACYVDLYPYRRTIYLNAIEQCLPIIIKFIEVVNKYAKNDFFDL